MADQLTPAHLDAIRIAGDERTLGLVGMGLTFYLPQPHRLDLRMNVARCVDEYRELVRGRLRNAVFKKNVMSETECAAAVDLVEGLRGGEREAFSVLLTGADPLDEVSHYNLETLCPARVSYERVGDLSVTFPMSDLAARPPGFFQELAARWAKSLAPVHGYGGFTLVRSIDAAFAESAEPKLYPIVGRFPGLEIDAPATHIRYCVKGIKGINWLTILSTGLVEKLGGKAKLERALSTGGGRGIVIREYGGGVMIQAGPYPQLGDADAGYVPAEYQRVYRAVQAVQADYPDIVMHTPEGVDALEFTRQWLHRFE